MRSTERILTTHVGSLPRPEPLVRLLYERYDGKPVEEAELESSIVETLGDVVGRQVDAGIDVISDGEIGKIAFNQYIHERYSGFSEVGTAQGNRIQDLEEFPEVADMLFKDSNEALFETASKFFSCTGPMEVKDPDAVQRDIARFRAALGDREPALAFINAVSPGQITFNFPNAYYDSHEAYLWGAAEAMRYEYKAIADAGFNLQIDAPDLAMAAHVYTEGSDLTDIAAHSAVAIEALNHALEGIDPAQVRLHICWGNYAGPHTHDVPLADVLPYAFKANVENLSFEGANPRHAHELALFESVDLPEGMVLMPGLLDVTTNRVEHPGLIAQRIVSLAELVGKENVMANSDCGFGTVAGMKYIADEVVWAKFASLAEGARLASAELWGA